MLLGIGTDILRIDRIKRSVMDENDPFIRKVFSANEIIEASCRENKELYYATRFSAKEAVFKCLSLKSDNIKLSEIEILNKENGEPYVNLLGFIGEQAKEKGVKSVLISISYDTDYVIAYAAANGFERGDQM